MKARYLILLLLVPLFASAAQGYKIVHPDGTVEFSDQPSKNAEEIKLQDAQGYQSEGNGQTAAPTVSPTPPGNGDYLQFSITSPAAEQTIPNTAGVVTVSMTVSPALKQGDQVVIALDGSEAARGASTSFTLSGLERGAHQLGASIVDSSGGVVRQADPITFYVFQTSLLNPNRRR